MGQRGAARAGRAPLRPHQRLAAAFGGANDRLWHRPNVPGGPVWQREMTIMVVVGLALAAVAALTDAWAIAYVRTSQAPFIGWMAALTDLGRSHWYLIPAAAIFLGVGFADWTRAGFRGRARLALLFGQAGFSFAAVAISGILVNVLKVIFGRARPVLFEQHGAYHFEPLSFGYAFASFPSGHSMTVGAVAGILMLWYPRLTWLFAALGLFIASTRVTALAHYPSDVVTGCLFGLTCTIVLARYLATRGVVFRLQQGKMFPTVMGRAGRK